MDIEGPIEAGVVAPSPGGKRELQLGFTDAFPTLQLAQQGAQLRTCPERLRADVNKPDLDERTRQGTLPIHRIREPLPDPVSQREVRRAPGLNPTDRLS